MKIIITLFFTLLILSTKIQSMEIEINDPEKISSFSEHFGLQTDFEFYDKDDENKDASN